MLQSKKSKKSLKKRTLAELKFISDQHRIHNDPTMDLYKKKEIIDYLFEERLFNAYGDKALIEHIEGRRKLYHSMIISFAPKAKSKNKAKYILDAERAQRMFQRSGLRGMTQLFQNTTPNFLDGFVNTTIDDGRQHYGDRRYVPNNLVNDIVYKTLFTMANCHTDTTIEITIQEDMVIIADNFVEKLTRDLTDCVETHNTQVIIIHLKINFDGVFFPSGEGSSHSNILIYRPRIGVVEHFEPHGSFVNISLDPDQNTKINLLINTGVRKVIEQVIQPITPSKTIMYLPPTTTCPWFGPQSLTDDTIGYCAMWSNMMTHLILIFPDRTTEAISNGLVASVNRYTTEKRNKFVIILDTPDAIARGMGLDDVRLNMLFLVKGYIFFCEKIVDAFTQSLSDPFVFRYPSVRDQTVVQDSFSSNRLLFEKDGKNRTLDIIMAL